MIQKENEFFERSHNIFLQMAKDFIEVCPRCKGIHISIRKRKTPKYRCQDCKNEFDDPKAMMVNQTPKQKRELHMQYSNPDK